FRSQQTDKGHGSLIFQGLWSGYYKAIGKAAQVDGSWELLKLRDTIPAGVYQRQLKIYPAIPSSGSIVYFDDFKIIHEKNPDAKAPQSAQFSAPEINLIIEQKHLDKLRKKRSEAFGQGFLDAGKKDLVPAKLVDGDLRLNVQLRLKGDLLDHLQGKRWSFRVVPEEGKAWKGMTAFSLQNSKSRDHLSEWIFHKMLEEEDVLSPKYDFVKLSINGEVIGVYAYEEHFTDALLYKQQREKGPILRFNEDALWEFSSKGMLFKLDESSSHIEAFGGETFLKDDDFRQKFEQAQSLLYSYLKGNHSVDQLIDIDLMAKFAAIMDVCMAYHGFGASNQRFYYNAVSGKLEPVGYDGFTPDGIKWYPAPMILGEHINSRISKEVYFHKVIQPFHHFLFNDYSFVEQYIYYLDQF
ncbi:MAG: CotH kinase family protein, partial [Bacteroidota bacterium]